MVENILSACGITRLKQTKFSFGTTSAIITNLGLIVGLDKIAHPRLSMISAILVIALADNISDSLGIHIYQESECLDSREVWMSTLSNFLARLLVSLSFIVIIVALPLRVAVPVALGWGLLLLSVLSYTIAKVRGVDRRMAIIEHLSIALVVVLASNFLSKWLLAYISKF
ncbi:MAG: hypothetical protein ACM3OC_03030 [Deltaproteobacteria bacterium]